MKAASAARLEGMEKLKHQKLVKELQTRRQEQLQLDNRIEYNDALIEEREQGIVEIQQQIGEVNEIFQDLAVLVNEQGEMIEDIESNIVKTSQQTAAGKKQLKMAEKSQRKLQGK